MSERKIKRGNWVEYDGETCRVRKRRRVTGMAVFSSSDFELLLESPGRPGWPGWVGENEVETIPSEAN